MILGISETSTKNYPTSRKQRYKKLKVMKNVYHLTLFLMSASVSLATTSKEYCIKAMLSWEAFECSSLASKAGDTEEQARLFILGYKEGLEFIKAVQKKKVTNEDLNSEIPVGFLLRLEGPTPDFMLGRIFEAAQENALEKVYYTNGKYNSSEAQKQIAEDELRKRNASYLRSK
jgi:hypothetical protein